MTGPALHGGLEPEPGERLLAEFRPDRAAYWRGHLIMAALGGVVAGVALLALGNAAPWVGPVAAVLALAVRGSYLASEVLALRWQLTDRRLILPGARAFRLQDIVTVRAFLGDVQLITRQGDKHLIKYQPQPARVIAAIEQARGAA
ncbi:hypothetical protein SAMN05421774_10747 [Gemmobacter megaterium]|uniref:PH domain-containing protein n=1 Tax=Gemmobacter megaterium TaxID=1086013 RepID=A0A1N7Q3I0_9RHOB|nr:hypothetical protein [Gemmobacter megaterium]GGE22686.1 hypothetical protein GCM10011345_30780 [Gemmobacter megaterium]SIT17434.1 hypothetical protein SAMN05421774_10747 [Gemmobacter megaterium]